MKTLVVFSHLRWNFVFQRPQHLLTRLAEHYRVLYVEEPVRADGEPRLEAFDAADGVVVLRPHTPLASSGFADDQLILLAPLVKETLEQRDVDEYVVWFYTPMALPLLACLQPQAVVYDCMDELSAFAGAPPQLRERESLLMQRADLVFTGGPSLYEAKRAMNPRVLCLPSSVDAGHFSGGPQFEDDEWGKRAEEMQGDIPGPRLGYFGVIDERMNLDLICRLADANPEWSVVMVGPVVKIDLESVPSRANLYWLGQQSYEILPRLIQGWAVGLLPFALNESTRFISPTKTLEYMAAGKPVISTPIRDVVALYGDVVKIAAGSDEFISACADAIAETPAARLDRQFRMMTTVSRSSWELTAASIQAAIEEVVCRAHDAPAREPVSWATDKNSAVAVAL